MLLYRTPNALALSSIVVMIGAASLHADGGMGKEAVIRGAVGAQEFAESSPDDSQSGSFTSGALGLQSLNPEISATGDFLWSYQNNEQSTKRSDFTFRGLGLHVESYLDPYTRFKAAVSANETGAGLGEAYMTRFGLLPSLNLTLGKFRQQFGVVNRWHKHGLDQVDFPLALRMLFGNGGLNQTGISLDWVLPQLCSCSPEVILQVTNGENARVFAENTDGIPSSLMRFKLFRDLTVSTYTEFGITGLWGCNNEWTVGESESPIDRSLDTWVFGADWTVLWEPTHRMRYRSMTWRTEAYLLSKGIIAPDGSGEDTIEAWGLYSSVERKVSRTLVVGIRGDYFEPDVKDYVTGEPGSLSALAVTEDGASCWQIAPYVTWHQSPFVHFRIEYNHQEGEGTGDGEDVFWFQCIFAAGPHKHERY